MSVHDPLRALRPPSSVVDISRTLIDAGYTTWCVGGAVRDALLGAEHLDWDLATAATPVQVQRLFRRTVPVGVEFGTVGVLDRSGVMHEVTTFRRDVTTDGRHAVVEFGATLDEDLARRDLTINAIAYHPLEHRLHDPFDGQGDLTRRMIRAVGEASERMREDRLRALRAIRFSARFDFAFDDATWLAVVESAPQLGRLSPERVKQELEKTVEQVRCPSKAFQRWRDSGAFRALVPALATISDTTLQAIDRLALPGVLTRPQRRALRLAALFSDLDGRQTALALKALRFSRADVTWISDIVARWHDLNHAFAASLMVGALSDRDLRVLAARVGRLRVTGFMRLASARWNAMSSASAPAGAAIRSAHRRLLRIAFRDAIATADLAIDGDDLRRVGIPPGPLVGRVLASLLDAVIADPTVNTPSQLAALAVSAARVATSAERER